MLIVVTVLVNSVTLIPRWQTLAVPLTAYWEALEDEEAELPGFCHWR